MDRKEKKYSRFEYRVPRVGEGMGKGWVMIGEERLDTIGRVSRKDIRKGKLSANDSCSAAKADFNARSPAPEYVSISVRERKGEGERGRSTR